MTLRRSRELWRRIVVTSTSKLYSAIILGLMAYASAECDAAPPNILFIMSDDHAAHAIGAYGGRLAALDPTPTIDRLAAEGVLLRNCFCANSICVPSRATILTGKYSHNNGVKTLFDTLPPAKQTLPLLLNKAGYETAVVGKWHLGEEPAAFDYYYVLPRQGSYFNPEFRVRGDKDWPENTRSSRGYDSIHSSDAITNISLKWLKGRSKDKPFFLMHHFKAPHDNYENAERYDWLYEDVEIPEPPTLRERGSHGPVGAPQYGTSVSKRNSRRNMGHHMHVDQQLSDADYTTQSYQRYMKKYLRCVRGLDDNIGRLLDYLESTGELDNTVIVYTSDQGLMLGEHDYIDKRWMYDESLRMPFIVRYPERFKAGSKVEDIINNTDFAPTLLEIAGAKQSDDFDGRNFVSNMEGHTPDDWPDATYYRYWMHMAHHDNPAHFGIRTPEYKLIFFYGQPLDSNQASKEATPPYWELYDLRSDAKEQKNVYLDSQYNGVVQSLKEQLRRMKEAIGDSDATYADSMPAW